MKKQDFYGLPRSIQDRLIESSQGVAAPTPLAVRPRGDGRARLWWSLSLFSLLGWLWFISLGFGDLNSSFALASLGQKLIHVAFATATVFCAFRAYAISWATGRLPYGTGDYLFPSGVLSASFSELTEYDSRAFQAVEASGKDIVVKAPEKTFRFPVESAERARDVVDAFQHQKEAWRGVADGEPLDRARLHPLTDSGLPNPLAPTDPHPRPQFLSMGIIVGVSVVLAVAMGFGVSAWRDSLSRKALYREAVSLDSVAGYQSYLDRGGERPEVKELLLPRAELRQAIEEQTVDAIEAFKSRHADTQIAGEVQNALRAALLRELEKAKAKGTLTALAGVPKKFKSHELIAPEIAAARQEVYAKAMAQFQEQASTADEELVPFVQRLLTYAQTHGPEVELVFHQEFPQDPEKLDQIVSKSKKYYMGTKSLPTQYVLGEYARKRERKFLEAVRARLQKAFPRDVLDFRVAPLPTAANTEPPQAKTPRIVFMHRERLSGGYVGGKPTAMYLGVALHMTSFATIPGEEQLVMDFKWNAWRNPRFALLADHSKDIPDIYEEMIGGAFDKYVELYLGRWFENP